MGSVLTQSGKEVLADTTDGSDGPPFWMAWGTGVGTSSSADTQLFSESTEMRVECDLTRPADSTNKFTGILTADGEKSITNAGVFDSQVGGRLVCKSDFAAQDLLEGEKLSLSFELSRP